MVDAAKIIIITGTNGLLSEMTRRMLATMPEANVEVEIRTLDDMDACGLEMADVWIDEVPIYQLRAQADILNAEVNLYSTPMKRGQRGQRDGHPTSYRKGRGR
jgi:hypothetical protein